MADTVMEFRSSMTRELAPIELALIGGGPIHRFRVPGTVPTAKTVGTRFIRTESLLESLAAGRPVFFTLGAAVNPATLLACELLRVRVEQAKRQREAEQCQRQQAAMVQAARLWNQAVSADSRLPYLVQKGVRPHSLRQLGNMLLVTLYNNGQLADLQRIYPDGGKRFVPVGRVNGCYFPVGACCPVFHFTSVKAGQPWRRCTRQLAHLSPVR